MSSEACRKAQFRRLCSVYGKPADIEGMWSEFDRVLGGVGDDKALIAAVDEHVQSESRFPYPSRLLDRARSGQYWTSPDDSDALPLEETRERLRALREALR